MPEVGFQERLLDWRIARAAVKRRPITASVEGRVVQQRSLLACGGHGLHCRCWSDQVTPATAHPPAQGEEAKFGEFTAVIMGMVMKLFMFCRAVPMDRTTVNPPILVRTR